MIIVATTVVLINKNHKAQRAGGMISASPQILNCIKQRKTKSVEKFIEL